MSAGERWLRRPQTVWLRKALFQIHLWVGVGLGLYVLLISVSGSAIVFRNELSQALSPAARTVAIAGPRLSRDDLKQAIRRTYPDYSISYVWEAKRPDEATEVWLLRNGRNKMRLFDPYTGKDLGPSVPMTLRALSLAIDFHVNLLAGKTGRWINGIGGILTTVLVITGAIVWWPGVQSWRRSVFLRRESNWKALNWSLHSVVGVWTLAFVLVWGVTGIFVVFPVPFEKAVNAFAPLLLYRLDDSPLPKNVRVNTSTTVVNTPNGRRVRRVEQTRGDEIIRWFYYLHFGNFAGSGVKTVWVLFGLAPVLLMVTGVLMWWNRVLCKLFERRPGRSYDVIPAEAEVIPAALQSTGTQVSS